MKTAFKKISIALLIVAFALTLATSFVACNKKKDTLPDVNYAVTNNFEITTTDYTINPEAKEEERIGARIYAPNGVNAKYGVLFFLGTLIAPEYYDYLGTALAKQGYVMAIAVSPFAFFDYEDKTKPIADDVIARYPNLKFFVGGHSQGGGAAMRFACEYFDNVLGAFFLAPLTFGAREATQAEYDKDAEKHPEWFNVTDSGKIYRADTLARTNLPTLLLEAANDHVLSAEQKLDALEKMPLEAQHFVINPGAHMSFSAWDDDSTLAVFMNDGDGITEAQKAAQKELTVSYVLDFLQITVANK